MPDFESIALPLLDDLYRAAFALLGSSAQAEQAVTAAIAEGKRRWDRSPCRRAWLFSILLRHTRALYVRTKGAGECTSDELAALRELPFRQAAAVLLTDAFECDESELREAMGRGLRSPAAELRVGRQRLARGLSAEPAPRLGFVPG
ncbi:MAG: hypothetical protein SFV18_15125 [Bryobacteraceae bacterium]|nr:hypothetical protein [Bryobacteraceae bacterium]